MLTPLTSYSPCLLEPLPCGFLEDKVRHARFQIPIDNRDRGQVEGSMSHHRHENASRECEDRPEHEACDRSLLDAGNSLDSVMLQPEQYGSCQDNRCLGPHTRSEKLAEPLEHISAEEGLLTDARDNCHGEDGTWESRFPTR